MAVGSGGGGATVAVGAGVSVNGIVYVEDGFTVYEARTVTVNAPLQALK